MERAGFSATAALFLGTFGLAFTAEGGLPPPSNIALDRIPVWDVVGINACDCEQHFLLIGPDHPRG